MTYTVSEGCYGADVKKDSELFATTFCDHKGHEPDIVLGIPTRVGKAHCITAMTRRAEEIVFALNVVERIRGIGSEGVGETSSMRDHDRLDRLQATADIITEIRTQEAT